MTAQPEPPEVTAPADEKAVLPGSSLILRLAGPAFASFSVIMVLWIIYLATTLPSRQLSPHYDVAWVGFDTFECVGLAATAYFALRRSLYLSTAATATAVLLIVDAWFDCLTTAAPQVIISILLCVFVELPLAGVCLWLSHHTIMIAERQITLLRWQSRRRSPRVTSRGRSG